MTAEEYILACLSWMFYHMFSGGMSKHTSYTERMNDQYLYRIYSTWIIEQAKRKKNNIKRQRYIHIILQG